MYIKYSANAWHMMSALSKKKKKSMLAKELIFTFLKNGIIMRNIFKVETCVAWLPDFHYIKSWTTTRISPRGISNHSWLPIF